MILVRKKADNGIWMSFEDSDTVTIDANGTHAVKQELPPFTSVDYELVTGVSDPDNNAAYGNGVYTWDGSAWALVNSAHKTKVDAEIAASKAEMIRMKADNPSA
tara:strand:- start:46 stop:357 length:312 start_codon:yes stop_codon:yes gene_type:complete